MAKDRIVFIDYIRVVACFLVMIVHSTEYFYGVSDNPSLCDYSLVANESTRFWVSFYEGAIASVCVPLFMMISAFLLLPTKQSMGQFYKKRFTHILPPFVIFLLLYCVLPLAWGGMEAETSLNDLKTMPWNFPSLAGHLWFMYPLIGLYLIFPVISSWLEKASAKEERLFIILFALSTFFPYIRHFVIPEVWGESYWNQFHSLWYFSGFIGYAVLAHYIKKHLKWNKKKRLVVGCSLFLAGAFVTAYGFWDICKPNIMVRTVDAELFWLFCTPNILVQTLGAYLLFTCIEVKKAPRIISGIAKLTFGMYLMHMFFLGNIAPEIIGPDTANPLIPVWAAIPLIACMSYICSAVCTKLISFIPFSKYIIGTK